MAEKAKDFKSRYELKTLIGRGGMGEVYEAYDKVLETQVALKLVRKELSSDLQMQKRFYKEARALLLLRESHIVDAYDFGLTENKQLFLSMELVNGKSLYELNASTLPLSVILDLVSQLLAALDHAHARGVVHRDLKTENVLVTFKDERLYTKLVDFGLAMMPANSEIGGADTEIFGSPGYIAPEQIVVGMTEACPATDIYSVGAILYELISGKLPFEGKTADAILKAQLHGSIQPLAWRPHLMMTGDDVRFAIEKIIQRALSRKMWDRFLSASEFKRALDDIKVNPAPIPEDEIIASLREASKRTEERDDVVDFTRKLEAIDAVDAAAERAENLVSDVEDVFAIDVEDEESSHEIVENTCIGREQLWAELNDIAQKTLSGHGDVICLKGDFGIGKSYLLQKIKQCWKFPNSQVISVDCPYYDEDEETDCMRQSASVFWSILLGISGISESVYENANLIPSEQRVERRMREFGIEDVSFINATKTFMMRPPLRPDTSLIPASVLMQSVERLVRLLISVVSQRKNALFVLIDNIQRCNQTLFSFLNQIKVMAKDVPLTFITTYETTEVSALFPERAKIASNPENKLLLNDCARFLSHLESQEIARILMTYQDVDRALAERVARNAWGNVLYAVSCIEQLRHDMRLMRNERGALALAPSDNARLPLSEPIREYYRSVQYRIGIRMGLDFALYREVLIRIAILGINIDMDEVEMFWDFERDKALTDCWFEAIVAWCDYGILKIDPETQRKIWFVQPWICQAIEFITPANKVRELHRQAARAYEANFPDPTCEQMANLARHWKMARERVAFVRSGRLAANAELREGKLVEAQRMLRSLVKMYIHRKDYSNANEIARAVDWFDVMRLYATNSLTVGDEYAVNEALAELKELAQAGDASKRAYVDIIESYAVFVRGNVNQAKKIVQNYVNDMALSREVVCEAQFAYAKYLLASGQSLQAIPVLEDVCREYSSSGVYVQSAVSSILLSHILWRAGDVRRAYELESRAFDALSRRHELRHMNELEALRAYRHCMEDAIPDVVAKLENAAWTFADFGDVWHEQAMFPIRVSMSILLRDFSHVSELIERAKKLQRNFEWMCGPAVDGYERTLAAFSLLVAGEELEARRAFDDAKSIFEARRDRRTIGLIFIIRALFALDNANDEDAANYIALAHDNMPSTPWFEIAYDIIMAMLLNLQKNHEQAKFRAKSAYKQAALLEAERYQLCALIIVVESCVLMRDITGVREAMSGYRFVTLPPHFKAIFGHAIERIHERVQKLPIAFANATAPLFVNIPGLDNHENKTQVSTISSLDSANVEPNVPSIQIEL